jgi:hypothetical protein
LCDNTYGDCADDICEEGEGMLVMANGEDIERRKLAWRSERPTTTLPFLQAEPGIRFRLLLIIIQVFVVPLFRFGVSLVFRKLSIDSIQSTLASHIFQEN